MLEDGQLLGVAWGRTLARCRSGSDAACRESIVVQLAGKSDRPRFRVKFCRKVHLICTSRLRKTLSDLWPMWVEGQAARRKACRKRAGPSRKRLPCIIELIVLRGRHRIRGTLQNRVCARRFLPALALIRAPRRRRQGGPCAKRFLMDEGRAVPPIRWISSALASRRAVAALPDIMSELGADRKAAAIARRCFARRLD